MSEQPFLPLSADVWIQVKDGDDTVRSIFDRHYSRQHYKDGRSPLQFVGPGYKMVMMTPCAKAIFVWRKFIDDCIDKRTGKRQAGINCAVFRNEGAGLSSELIIAAEFKAWARWPRERLYTYVDTKKIRKKRDSGRCFRKAGWNPCGFTKNGLMILEKLPP